MKVLLICFKVRKKVSPYNVMAEHQCYGPTPPGQAKRCTHHCSHADHAAATFQWTTSSSSKTSIVCTQLLQVLPPQRSPGKHPDIRAIILHHLFRVVSEGPSSMAASGAPSLPKQAAPLDKSKKDLYREWQSRLTRYLRSKKEVQPTRTLRFLTIGTQCNGLHGFRTSNRIPDL